MRRVKDLEVGEVFEYGKFEWIKLDDLDGGVFAITRGILPDTRRFDKKSNDWRGSELREWLNKNFLSVLIDNGAKEKDFLKFKRDLTADDGTTDYDICLDTISLITCTEYRKYRKVLRIIGRWWWTLTACSCLESYFCNVRNVTSDGSLDWHYAYNSNYGVRPICYLDIETLVSTGTEKEGLEKDKPDQVKDSIKDVYVALIGLSLKLGLKIEDCIEIAYKEIKERK